jgi:hypothetical protein
VRRPDVVRGQGNRHGSSLTAPYESSKLIGEETTRKHGFAQVSASGSIKRGRPPAPTGGRLRCLGCLAQGASTEQVSDTAYAVGNRPGELYQIVTSFCRGLARQFAEDVQSYLTAYAFHMRREMLPGPSKVVGSLRQQNNSSHASAA